MKTLNQKLCWHFNLAAALLVLFVFNTIPSILNAQQKEEKKKQVQQQQVVTQQVQKQTAAKDQQSATEKPATLVAPQAQKPAAQIKQIVGMGRIPGKEEIIGSHLTDILQSIIAWEEGGTGDDEDWEISEEDWNRSGLADELGDYDDYQNDQERREAIEELAWKQSGAEEETGTEWDDYDSDEERNQALEESEDSQSGKNEDDGGNQSVGDGQSSNGIVGRQGPWTPMPGASASIQLSAKLIQMLRSKQHNQ